MAADGGAGSRAHDHFCRADRGVESRRHAFHKLDDDYGVLSAEAHVVFSDRYARPRARVESFNRVGS